MNGQKTPESVKMTENMADVKKVSINTRPPSKNQTVYHLIEQTPDEIREQYELEKELAGRLRRASSAERHRLYAQVYDEFYRRFPRHALIRRSSPELTRVAVEHQMRLLRPYLKSDTVFLELGPGDCSLSLEVARHIRQVFAVDVSSEITANTSAPPNFRLLLNDGFGIPVDTASVDVAYSTDFMEHLHPDDAIEQLGNVFSALKPGGVYICVTPNQISGPHDISKNFDRIATGLHLKEYSVTELSRLFRHAGFTNIRLRTGIKGHYANIPLFPAIWCESMLSLLTRPVVRKLASYSPVRQLLAIIHLVAFK